MSSFLHSLAGLEGMRTFYFRDLNPSIVMYHGTEYAPDQDRTIDLLEFRTTSFLGCLHNVAYATYELDDNPVEDTLCLMSRSGAPLSGAGVW